MADSTKLQPPRGMRDFYPQDMLRRNRIFDAWRAASERSAFQPYDACVVESLELLTRKAGEEIVDQIYHFEDKSGRKLALRPEITPTLARMVTAKKGGLSFPLKWYTIGQCFRYERMTRGRKREHYQWNLDIIGEENVIAEAEVLATATQALASLGLGTDQYRIHYSSRALLSALLAKLGIPEEHHQAAFLALDKRGKISDMAITELLQSNGIDQNGIPLVLKLLELESLDEALAIIGEHADVTREIQQFLSYADALGIQNLLKFDISVIRGLSYYTGMVFEAFDIHKKFRAIFGGGRYARLLESIGGGDIPAVGLGFGDVVIDEIINETNISNEPVARNGYHIAGMQTEQLLTATKVAAALRKKGDRVYLALSPLKPKTFFSKADADQAAYAVLIGPDDITSGTIRIKNLAEREETTIKLEELFS